MLKLSNVKIKNLIGEKINNQIFFTAKDTIDINNQNEYPKNLKLPHKILNKIKSLSTAEIQAKYKTQNLNLYEMSIPIFSTNNKQAYIQLNNYCGFLCGEGVELYLKKINGNWKIIYKRTIWVS